MPLLDAEVLQEKVAFLDLARGVARARPMDALIDRALLTDAVWHIASDGVDELR
eukprot:CAMPEP_0185614946 /NCGR_PEP_ID=MMETSP0436-20130131/33857_1 /TAXON_ID=626734 ORGANISM="Favella taraikaensis, Strain Fe Narragansett Bay" /NCGR_SAMPLE_ID=MMETSP0436 /ASSEMBLY_ACC=CAM_ASM_000390 /LENGTH=53 /DNA_ID=CAMNT_0028250237 /DNA_START=76 /DNA_END=233 /DNA_ORIENTATION=+